MVGRGEETSLGLARCVSDGGCGLLVVRAPSDGPSPREVMAKSWLCVWSNTPAFFLHKSSPRSFQEQPLVICICMHVDEVILIRVFPSIYFRGRLSYDILF